VGPKSDVIAPRCLVLLVLLAAACDAPPGAGTAEQVGFVPVPLTPETPGKTAARERMIEEQVRRIGVDSERVIAAMSSIDREAFLPPALRPQTFEDHAIERPDGETITAPDLTAAMLHSLDLAPGDLVLECGTRSGWLTALLSRLAGRVLTIDARRPATEGARRVISMLGIDNVEFRTGDPLKGWQEKGPFDAIVVNGAVPAAPVVLYRALKPGGRLLVPVGVPPDSQVLILTIRGDETPRETRPVLTVRFAELAR
jgi:protein-L-isoaspartate(D-aspartate) O-methyltransferase